jgi:hypothetical protein
MMSSPLYPPMKRLPIEPLGDTLGTNGKGCSCNSGQGMTWEARILSKYVHMETGRAKKSHGANGRRASHARLIFNPLSFASLGTLSTSDSIAICT